MSIESPELFAHMVSYATDIISIHDSNGACLYVSPSVEHVLGYEPKLLIGHPISSLIEPADLARVRESLFLLREQTELLTFEFRMTTRDARVIWVETTAKRCPHPYAPGLLSFVATTRDVTNRKMAEEKLVASEETNRTLINMMPDMITVHRNGEIIYLNPAGARIMEADDCTTLIGQSFISLVEPGYLEFTKHRLERLNMSGQTEPVESKLTTLGGNILDVEISSAVIDYQGEPAHLTLVRDITQRKRVERQLHEMNYQLQLLSTHDSLTGVANRRSFDDTLQQAFAIQYNSDHTLSLIMLDVDCFKIYNDAYGHQQGDICLQSIAGALVRAAGKHAFVTRYGGEEFAVILPLGSVDEAVRVSRAIHHEVGDLALEHRASTVKSVVTVSIGIGYIAPAETEFASPSTLIRRADQALYKAKQLGRDRTVLWCKDIEYPVAAQTLNGSIDCQPTVHANHPDDSFPHV